MSFKLTVKHDGISPDLKKKAKALSDPTPVLEAMGLQFVSLAQRSFRDSALRAASWPAKSDGSPSNLLHKGALRASIRITSVSKTSVTVGSDRKYAAIHQMGGVIKPKDTSGFLWFNIGGKRIRAKKVTIPARPYFPVVSNKIAPFALTKMNQAVSAKLNAMLK